MQTFTFSSGPSRAWLWFYGTLRTKLAEGANCWRDGSFGAAKKSSGARQAGGLTWLKIVLACRTQYRPIRTSWRKSTFWCEMLRGGRSAAIAVVARCANAGRSGVAVTLAVRPGSAWNA